MNDREVLVLGKLTIWVVGAAGKLGTELVNHLKKNVDYKVIGTDMDVDVTDMDAINTSMDIYRPDVVINCASLSDAAYCEKNMVEAFKVNALGARNLAIASRRINAKLIQMSTDDVFDGKSTGYLTEFDTPVPTSVYGKSKLAGENYVRELNPKHVIVRSSWVYGASKKGDYFSYVVDHAKKNEPFEAAMDHISSPTSVKILSDFVEDLVTRTEYGIYHASCEGACTRYGFATAILNGLGYNPALAKATFTNKHGVQKSTLLENLMMKMTEIHEMPSWQDGLKDYLTEMKEV